MSRNNKERKRKKALREAETRRRAQAQAVENQPEVKEEQPAPAAIPESKREPIPRNTLFAEARAIAETLRRADRITNIIQTISPFLMLLLFRIISEKLEGWKDAAISAYKNNLIPDQDISCEEFRPFEKAIGRKALGIMAQMLADKFNPFPKFCDELLGSAHTNSSWLPFARGAENFCFYAALLLLTLRTASWLFKKNLFTNRIDDQWYVPRPSREEIIALQQKLKERNIPIETFLGTCRGWETFVMGFHHQKGSPFIQQLSRDSLFDRRALQHIPDFLGISDRSLKDIPPESDAGMGLGLDAKSAAPRLVKASS